MFPQLDEKKRLYCILFGISVVTLLLNVLFLKGYIMQDWPPWTSWSSWIDVFKYYRNITEEIKWHERFNLVKSSEYDKFYSVHGLSMGPGESYISLLWPSNRKIFRRIFPQSEKAYNLWLSLDKERRGTETIHGRVYPKNRRWHMMEKFMNATEKSYYTFFHKTFDLTSLKKSHQA